jgi:hypothetical protein
MITDDTDNAPELHDKAAAASAGDSHPQENGERSTTPARPVRFKKISEKLYECLVVGNFCKNRFSFGTRPFCLWLLKTEDNRTEENLPCSQDDQKNGTSEIR